METMSLEEILIMQLEGKLKTKDDWDILSCDYKLAEEVIDKYQDKVNWYCIFECQDLSNEFKEKYKDKLELYL